MKRKQHFVARIAKIQPDRKGKAINVNTEETVIEAKGEKDACYHKVKSRYSVWAKCICVRALVKCRKVGAKNWGNKSKKNEEFTPIQIAALEFIDAVEVNEADKSVGKDMKRKEPKRCLVKRIITVCQEGRHRTHRCLWRYLRSY